MIGRIASWLVLVMVMLMAGNVALRYIWNLTLLWQQELVLFIHAIIFLSAAGYTLLAEKHVRVDAFYQGFSVKTKAWVNLLGTLVLLWPSCIAIAFYSTHFISQSWRIFEHSAEYNGMEGVFILKSFIYVFCGSLLLQGINIFVSSLRILQRK